MGLNLSFRSNGASVRPETDLAEPTHAELVIRVNVLAAEVAKLTREIRTLRTAQPAQVAPTDGRVPSTPEDAKSGREVIRYIAAHAGRGERAVAKSLESHSHFAPLREQCPDLTTNVPILRWLAHEDRYARIIAGESFGW